MTLEAAELPADAVEVGKVLGAWGIKGGIKVAPYAADVQALLSTRRWYLLPAVETSAVARPATVRAAATPEVRDSQARLLKVSEARLQGEWVVALAPDVQDRTAAEALRGARVFVPRASFPTAGDGEYYWVDLIGLDVVNRDDVPLGRVVGLMDTGAHSVLRVQPRVVDNAPASDERLIPFVAVYVDAVLLAERRIVVDWGVDY